jgi:hypothetical protein
VEAGYAGTVAEGMYGGVCVCVWRDAVKLGNGISLFV